MKKRKVPSYKEDLIQRLEDPARAETYLNAALADEDKNVFLLALRDVVEAQGGVSKFARLTHISREHIYRMLSEKGNPEFISLKNLLNSLGLKLTVEISEGTEEAA